MLRGRGNFLKWDGLRKQEESGQAVMDHQAEEGPALGIQRPQSARATVVVGRAAWCPHPGLWDSGGLGLTLPLR